MGFNLDALFWRSHEHLADGYGSDDIYYGGARMCGDCKKLLTSKEAAQTEKHKYKEAVIKVKWGSIEAEETNLPLIIIEL